MSDKRNIDELFKDGLKDLEVKPNLKVWEGIREDLEVTAAIKPRIPLWKKLGGIAAAVLIIAVVGSQFDFSSTDSEDVLNQTESNVLTEPSIDAEANTDSGEIDMASPDNSAISGDLNADLPEIVDSTQDANAFIDDEGNTGTNVSRPNTAKDRTDPSRSDSNTGNRKSALSRADRPTSEVHAGIEQTQPATASSKALAERSRVSLGQMGRNQIFASSTLNASHLAAVYYDLSSEVTELTVVDFPEKRESFDRWRITPSIAPVYFNTLSDGSSIHSQFSSNYKQGQVNTSVGIMASYNLTPRLSIRSGINKVELGYNTNDVIVYNNVSPPVETSLKTIALNEAAQNMSFISAEEFVFGQIPGVLSNQIKGSIDQQFGFIEVPLELQYQFPLRKAGLRVIGGFSALFLDQNSVYSVFQGERTLLGKATNLNNTSYSANLGLGIDFSISRQFNLNFEPIFKYQINTFSETSGNFQPYFFGVYSGLSYKF